MTTEYKKYTEYMNHENQFIITPTYEYFENNTIEEIELIVEQYPNIFDYKYILDQYAVDHSIQGFNTFNEALEELKRLDPKNWEQAQTKEQIMNDRFFHIGNYGHITEINFEEYLEDEEDSHPFNEEDIRQMAIDWQRESDSVTNMNYIIQQQEFFEQMASFFGLTEEFKENAII